MIRLGVPFVLVFITRIKLENFNQEVRRATQLGY